jgi:hypothetical protein
MDRIIECCDTKAMSPVYDSRPAIMAAGLPCDELCRGMSRARELRRTHLKALMSRRVADPARRFARDAGNALSGWVEGLHRGPFTSAI